jgi:hypothetical protein
MLATALSTPAIISSIAPVIAATIFTQAAQREKRERAIPIAIIVRNAHAHLRLVLSCVARAGIARQSHASHDSHTRTHASLARHSLAYTRIARQSHSH